MRTIEDLVNGVEAAIDELEQAAFIASLMPADVDAALLKPLAELCAAAVAGTEAAASGIVAAARRRKVAGRFRRRARRRRETY